MSKVLYMIIAVFLLIGVFASPINDGIKGWRTRDTTDAFTVTTAAGQTTANVTLTRDLFSDDTAEVISITSNITGESPIATTYTAATNYLLISALNAGATHTLTVNYYAESDSGVILAIGAFLSILIIGGLIVGVYRAATSKRG